MEIDDAADCDFFPRHAYEEALFFMKNKPSVRVTL